MGEVLLEELMFEPCGKDRIGRGDIVFLAQKQAKLVEVTRADACPIIDQQGFDVSHAGIKEHANTLPDEVISCNQFSPRAGSGIVYVWQNNANVNAALASPDQVRHNLLVEQVRIFGINVIASAFNGVEYGFGKRLASCGGGKQPHLDPRTGRG